MRSLAPFIVLVGMLILVAGCCNHKHDDHDRDQSTLAPIPPVRNMSISRFHESLLTDAEADSILADANHVLETIDGTGDVSCTIGLTRNGPVTTFSTGDGEIDSRAEYDEIIALPGEIKVVNDINYCDGWTLQAGYSFIGCSPQPGHSIIVKRLESPGPRVEGILWAHEYGHNCGLGHRDPPDNGVMSPSVTEFHTFLNTAEKDAYENNAPNAPATAHPAVMPSAATAPASAPSDVKSFVRAEYIEGFPRDQAAAFGPAVVDELIQMLNDPAEAKWRVNIVALLGIIGDPRGVDPMIRVVEEGNGVLTRSEYAAKKVAITALGDLIKKDQALTNPATAKAFNYLKQGVENPMIWSQRVQWTGPFTQDTNKRDWQLTKSATWGLVRTAKPEATQSIQTLQQKLGSMQNVPADVKGVLTEALAALNAPPQSEKAPQPKSNK